MVLVNIQKFIHTLVYPVNCFCADLIRNMLRPMNSISKGPLFHLICCKITFLVRSNAVWNIRVEALCNFMDIGFGRSIVDREGKSTGRESVLVKTKICPLHGRNGPV